MAYFPNNYSGFGNYMQPQQQAPVQKMNNFLSPEQMSEIQQFPQDFPTKLTKEEYLRSICTHKSNNMITLDKTRTGEHHCSICGADFFLWDTNTSEDDINQCCKNMYDLLQSIKTYLLNAPDQLKDIYMMLGFIQKMPLLWKTAVKSFDTTFNAQNFGNQQNQEQNSFQLLGNILGGNPGFNGFYNPAYQVQQPGPYAQNPYQPAMPNPQYQQPQYYGGPTGYGQYQTPPPPPQYTGYQVTPVQQSNPIGYVDNSAQQTQQVPIIPPSVQMPDPQPVQQSANPNIKPPQDTPKK